VAVHVLSGLSNVHDPCSVVAESMHGRIEDLLGQPRPPSDVHVFFRHAATFPWRSQAAWFVAQMIRWGQLEKAHGLAEVIELAVAFLAIAALFQLVDGGQVIGVHVLRGLKDTAVPMWLAIGGYWAVGFVASIGLAFPLGLGGRGVWIGLALGLAFVAFAVNWRFHRRARLLPNGGLALP